LPLCEFFSLQVSLLFEVEDLAVASPATVSRCGMVFTDYKDLGWQPYVDCWLEKRQDKVCDSSMRATMSDKSVETFGSKIRLLSVMETFPLPPKKQC